MRRSLLAAPLVVATLLLAGCGGDDSGTATSASTPASASSATGGGSATSAGSTATSAPGTASNDPFCQETASDLQGLVGGGSSAVSELMPKLLDPSRAAESQAQVDALQADLNDAVSKAPDEIKPDVQTLANAITPLFDALRKAGFDLSKLDVSTISATADDPKVQQALQRVTTFVKDRCGLDITTPGG